MLNLWKHAWKKDDDDHPESKQDRVDEGIHPSGTGSGDSSLVSSLAIPPGAECSSSDPVVPPASRKRGPQSTSDPHDEDRSKRQKLESFSDQADLSTGFESPAKETGTDVDLVGTVSLTGSGRPCELVVCYEHPAKLPYSLLYKQLRQVDKEGTHLRRYFTAARYALVEVGSCASDLVWRRAVEDIEGVAPSFADIDDEDEHSPQAIAKRVREEMQAVVKNWTFVMPNLHSSSRGFNVTPKFLKLVHILKAGRTLGDAFRCIVFVKKRAVAWVMTDLLRALDMGYLRPQTLVGHGYSEAQIMEILQAFGDGKYNILIATKSAEDLDIPKATFVIRYDLFESQVSYAYARARANGPESYIIHMLERGSDVHRRMLTQVTQMPGPMQAWVDDIAGGSHGTIPSGSLHETHDPYLSDSEDEEETDSYITDPTTSGRIRVQDATSTIYRFASSLGPPDGSQPQPSHALFEYEVADVTASNKPQYICRVNLPPGPSVVRISGTPSLTMAQARRSAAFKMCQELFTEGVLEYTYFPQRPADAGQRRNLDTSGLLELEDSTWTPKLPPKGSAENKLNGTRCYPRKSPEFWTNVLLTQGNCLYPTIIHVDPQSNEPEYHAPMLILTRLPLPHLPDFHVFQAGVSTSIHLQQGAAFESDDDHIYNLYRYTVRICRATMNKPFVCRLDRMPYFFAPVAGLERPASFTQDRWRQTEVAQFIQWDMVKLGATHWAQPLNGESLETLSADIVDAIIQDRWVEFTRRYFSVKVRPDLTPLSKPEDSPREAEYENFVEYCKARRKGFEGLANYEQPLIEVARVSPVLNRLNPTVKPVTGSSRATAKYLIPELCAKFVIPASTFRTALLLPSITRRIDDLLLVKELNATFFDHAIAEDHLHAAISAPSAGYEFDYERLELLGDAYLKYLSSIYLFVTNPSQHEGALHSARLRIISNRALLLNADMAGLPPFIQAKPFVSKVWQPPNFNVLPPMPPGSKKDKEEEEKTSAENADTKADGENAPENAPEPPEVQSEPKDEDIEDGEIEAGEIVETVKVEEGITKAKSEPASSSMPEEAGAQAAAASSSEEVASKRSKRKRQLDERDVQWLGDKAVADVAEAIIGAAYVTGGRETALKASKALCIAVPRVDRWSDFGRKALAPPPDVTAKLRSGAIESVEGIIGHKFKRPHILAQALTHASIQGFEMTCYERLEFIGDAILDFLVIRHIYNRDTQLSPGALTLLKGAMVSNSTLAAVCVWAGLHQYLMFESYNLANSIQAYEKELKAKQEEEYARAEEEGRAPGQYWIDIEPPKALSDVVESLIGAVYISDNFSPVGSIAVFDNVLKPFFDKHIMLKTLSHHPTKILFELFQAQGCQQFKIHREQEEDDEQQQITRCDVILHDVILASATDTTSALAAKRASLWALDALEGDPGFVTRTCDCRSLTRTRKAKKNAEPADTMAGFSEEEDVMAVEGELVEAGGGSDSESDKD